MDVPFRTDDEAATSVIGVVIMVAIAVILAGLIGQFMFDLVGERQKDNAPTAKFTYAVDDCGGITVTHNRGPAVDGTNLRFGGAAQEYTSFGSIPGWNGSDVDAGDSVTVDATPGEELTVVWASGSDDSTSVISRYQVPNDAEPASATTASVTITTSTISGEDEVIFDLSFSGSSSVYVVGDSPQMDPVGRTLSMSGTSYTYDYEQSGGKVSPTEYRFGIGKKLTPAGTDATITVYETSAKQCELDSDVKASTS